jgi:hypothetical protein
VLSGETPVVASKSKPKLPPKADIVHLTSPTPGKGEATGAAELKSATLKVDAAKLTTSPISLSLQTAMLRRNALAVQCDRPFVA